MEIKVEHITTVTLFEKTFEMTNNEFKDFLKACRTLLEREGCITDKPMIKFTKEGIEAFKPEVWTEPGNMQLQSAEPVWGPGEEEMVEADRVDRETEAEVVKLSPEINSGPIEAAEIIKPMDTKALKDRIDKMEPYKSRKDIDPYIKMHETGKPIEAIKNQMLADDFCPQGSLSYHVKKILAASTRVTKIELESVAETADETIERLKRENAIQNEYLRKGRTIKDAVTEE